MIFFHPRGEIEPFIKGKRVKHYIHGNFVSCEYSGHRGCSRSRRRAAKADKRMVLVHTHGLFIT
jgi:hypothetical protein